MISPLGALQAAIVARLNGDPELVALLGGPKCFENVPPTAAHPFIAFEEMRAREANADRHRAHEHRVALLCASRQPGAAEALAIAARVEELLHDAALALAGCRLVNLTVLSVEMIRAGKEPIRKARVSLRAVTELI